jgi:hypothetical protein
MNRPVSEASTSEFKYGATHHQDIGFLVGFLLGYRWN